MGVKFANVLFMRIGNIDFGTRPLFLAPMEDVTDIGFRKLCKRYGSAMDPIKIKFIHSVKIRRRVQYYRILLLTLQCHVE